MGTSDVGLDTPHGCPSCSIVGIYSSYQSRQRLLIALKHSLDEVIDQFLPLGRHLKGSAVGCLA
jgi:hypothetical protein